MTISAGSPSAAPAPPSTTTSTPPKKSTTTTTTTTTKEVVTTYISKDVKLENKGGSTPTPDVIVDDVLITPNNRIVSSTLYTWENPFRPDGDLSKEADTIVELIKEGKPINEENISERWRAKSPAGGGGGQGQVDGVPMTISSSPHATNLTSSPPQPRTSKKADPSIVSTTVLPGQSIANDVEVINLKNEKKKKGGCCSVV